ncbi:MAG: four helix bundle protein [Gemmatimonadaceae bacterium]
MQNYRHLRVWRKAFALALSIREVTSRFPRGYAELRSQMTSAAESILFNIVEGCGASSSREFARFLEIAIKSTTELEGELELAKAYGVVRESAWILVSPETIDTRRMLIGLRKKVLQTDLSRSPSS